MKPGVMALGAAFLLSTQAGPSWAFGGSFHCERPAIMEVRERVDGGSTLQSIVNEYLMRWDAAEMTRQCQAYANGQPHDISCLNGRRDWSAIKSSVPAEYFGQSNKSLANAGRAERAKGNGFAEAVAYCRSVGAIK